jgi:LDH2 family malate/lactate/ureidoglycolate dehydrogenase
MTKAKIKRLVDAAIEAARKHGVAAVEVRIDGATVRIPLAPDKPLAECEDIVQ